MNHDPHVCLHLGIPAEALVLIDPQSGSDPSSRPGMRSPALLLALWLVVMALVPGMLIAPRNVAPQPATPAQMAMVHGGPPAMLAGARNPAVPTT